MKFVISGLEMPPTSNRQYWARGMMVNGKPVGRMAPTPELTKYQKGFEIWCLKNNLLMAKARQFLREEILLKDKKIRVDTYAAFPHSDLWTKKDEVKRMDASNRLKALHDCLADALQVDDSYFWAGSFEKQETRKEPWVYVVLKPFEPRAVSDMKMAEL